MKNLFKRISLIAALTFCSANLSAQGKIDADNYPKVFAKVDSLVRDYIKYSAFEPSENSRGEMVVKEKNIQKFKSLFWPEAKIDDELLPTYFDQLEKGAPQVMTDYEWLSGKERTIEEYCNLRQKYFKGGISTSKVTNMTIAYDGIENGVVSLLIEKSISGQCSSPEVYISSTPVLEVELTFRNQFTELKISKITFAKEDYYFEKSDLATLSARFIPKVKPIRGYKVSNDEDFDFVIDKEDVSSELPGLKYGKLGEPDADEKNTLRKLGFTIENPWSFDATFHYGFPTFTGALATDGLSGYDDFSRWSEFGLNQGLSVPEIKANAIGGDLMFNVFLGNKRTYGFASGLSYMNYSGELKADDFRVAYKNSILDPNGIEHTYRAEVLVRNIIEKFTASSIGIPLFLKFKKRLFGPKLLFDVGAGIVYNLPLTGSSDLGNIQMDYGGSLRYSGTTWQYSEDSDEYIDALRFTGERLNTADFSKLIQSESGNTIFPFGYGVTPSNELSERNFKLRGGVSFVFRPAIYYRINSYFSAGLQVNYTQGRWTSYNPEQSASYQPTTEVGQYTTYFKSLDELKFRTIFASLSVRYTLSR